MIEKRVTDIAVLFKICSVKKQTKKNKPILKEDALKKLGERIKELRIKNGYTNYEYFAYEHNISRAQYGRYERGEDIRFGTLIKIINAFGLTIDEFFSEGFE
ncbi:MAG: helix-turn-helix transcriptional regulator [Bacteroidia bacterium]|nr:helix-turn-helix transcriptional regulator [Bacteroidia bacterium]